jgi:hypothetical protein
MWVSPSVAYAACRRTRSIFHPMGRCRSTPELERPIPHVAGSDSTTPSHSFPSMLTRFRCKDTVLA